MVITPVDTTFDTALPEIEPNRDDAATAILADPPRYHRLLELEADESLRPPR